MTRRNPTARQAALLEELLGLFLAEGFADATLDDFAARLRCSKSTLYALAPSKEQLARKVVGHFFRCATERVEKRVALAGDARERIAAYLEGAATEMALASPKFTADVAAFAPTRAVYERNANAAAERIGEFIREGVTEGLFRDVHANLVAEMAGWIIEGIQTGVLGKRAKVSDGAAFTALADLLLVGLNRVPPGIDPARA
ncbi:TetR/AcrR family transcriptional regulator [Actinokineospora globicatena]|uniref:TetR family transcriptional regulator n=1 Tax=Actinokineospora globicatena TaxID=103729 RepID=A0A9W6QQU0_9PSEU|nr:TetR/AcrR family transcriptional regulator [Actinokineospora globicatena]MCP2300740.1 transcriptional regulator, TetR family [Actinokineospora globicatena]GLW77635.1 TetR family transcriptional regulator [Actinokineospora globicatena]GLW84471.1 TetR family transcriptional regulator [Actinokineospora globicatena]GLW92947.1 TetR family transcriptional regulator [Actinokineospora globicatena]